MKTKLTTIALAALLFAGLPLASSSAYVGISVAIAPPAIPVYEQPLCPAPGYIWTPGYWDYADFGYYWVPGVWVRPPRIGVYWTPGYWGFRDGVYAFNEGYWGPSVGFYGGIDYGFGYGGRGYYGGRWSGNNFQYNTAVTRINKTVINNNYTYVNKNVNPVGSRAGFNGPKGATLQPTAQEKAVAPAERVPPTEAQQARANAAKGDPALRAKNNNGKPKPEAVQALNKKTGANTAAETAGNNNQQNGGANKNANQQAGAENQAKADNNQAKANGKKGNGEGQARAENKTKAAKRAAAADENSAKANRERHERSADRAERADNHAAPQAGRNAQARRNHEMNRPAAHPELQQQAERRQQGRPQMAQRPGPGNRGPARGPQEGKKKKHPQGPDGQ